MPWPPQPNEYLDLVEKVDEHEDALGNIFSIDTVEPVTGTLVASEVRFWFDDDDVSPVLNIKAKTADGTLATATIPLTPA